MSIITIRDPSQLKAHDVEQSYERDEYGRLTAYATTKTVMLDIMQRRGRGGILKDFELILRYNNGPRENIFGFWERRFQKFHTPLGTYRQQTLLDTNPFYILRNADANPAAGDLKCYVEAEDAPESTFEVWLTMVDLGFPRSDTLPECPYEPNPHAYFYQLVPAPRRMESQHRFWDFRGMPITVPAEQLEAAKDLQDRLIVASSLVQMSRRGEIPWDNKNNPKRTQTSSKSGDSTDSDTPELSVGGTSRRSSSSNDRALRPVQSIEQ